MNLNYYMAQRIVEHIAADLDLAFWIIDRSANVLAGTATTVVEQPFCANSVSTTVEQYTMLHLPLYYANEAVGELIMVNPPQNTEIAAMARTLAELIIHQMAELPRERIFFSDYECR